MVSLTATLTKASLYSDQTLTLLGYCDDSFTSINQIVSLLGPRTVFTGTNNFLDFCLRLSSLVPTVFTCTDCLHLHRLSSLVPTTVFTCTNDSFHLYQRLFSLVPTTVVFTCTNGCLHLYQRQFSLVPTIIFTCTNDLSLIHI